MRVLLGIDDTDAPGSDGGTARLVRNLAEELPPDAAFVGSLAYHLFPGVPATSNNKASCLVFDSPLELWQDGLFDQAVSYLSRHAARGSSPGLVLAGAVPASLVELGRQASWREIAISEMEAAAKGLQIWPAGRARGLIGAAAAVGLTAWGWTGRWLELGHLRSSERILRVSDLSAIGIRVVSADMRAEIPAPGDWVDTRDWLRPQMIAGEPVLPVTAVGDGLWDVIDAKMRKAFR